MRACASVNLTVVALPLQSKARDVRQHLRALRRFAVDRAACGPGDAVASGSETARSPEFLASMFVSENTYPRLTVTAAHRPPKLSARNSTRGAFELSTRVATVAPDGVGTQQKTEWSLRRTQAWLPPASTERLQVPRRYGLSTHQRSRHVDLIGASAKLIPPGGADQRQRDPEQERKGVASPLCRWRWSPLSDGYRRDRMPRLGAILARRERPVRSTR